jgi:RimJ/RimL family protein N-acetyltransferase
MPITEPNAVRTAAPQFAPALDHGPDINPASCGTPVAPDEAPSILTARLNLRPFSGADKLALARLLGDSEVVRPLSPDAFPYTLEHAETWISARPNLKRGPRTGVRFAIEDRATGLLAGGIEIGPGALGCELGFWIGRDYWGSGYATEATIAVLDYVVRVHGVRSVAAEVLGDNAASVRTLLKCGFEAEGTVAGFGHPLAVTAYRWQAPDALEQIRTPLDAPNPIS